MENKEVKKTKAKAEPKKVVSPKKEFSKELLEMALKIDKEVKDNRGKDFNTSTCASLNRVKTVLLQMAKKLEK